MYIYKINKFQQISLRFKVNQSIECCIAVWPADARTEALTKITRIIKAENKSEPINH